MIIYNYDEDTKEFTYSSEATLDPEETRISGKEVYLLPAYSTMIEPPQVQILEKPIFNEEQQCWDIIEDYRGLYQTNIITCEKIEKLGPVKDGYAVATEQQVSDIRKDSLLYIIEEGKLIPNPNYEEQKEQQRKEEQIAKLKQQLREIDDKKIRSTSAIALGIATQDDIDYLTNLEAQAEEIREEIRRLQECH